MTVVILLISAAFFCFGMLAVFLFTVLTFIQVIFLEPRMLKGFWADFKGLWKAKS